MASRVRSSAMGDVAHAGGGRDARGGERGEGGLPTFPELPSTMMGFTKFSGR